MNAAMPTMPHKHSGLMMAIMMATIMYALTPPASTRNSIKHIHREPMCLLYRRNNYRCGGCSDTPEIWKVGTGHAIETVKSG